MQVVKKHHKSSNKCAVVPSLSLSISLLTILMSDIRGF